MTKEEMIASFDPNGPGMPGKLFGLPFDEHQAEVVLIPIPWEVTVSYRSGTAKGPSAILEASCQIDLYMRDIPDAWKLGVAMLPVSEKILDESNKLRKDALEHMHAGELDTDAENKFLLTRINESCENLLVYVKNITKRYLQKNKLVGIVGGDHSSPLGLIHALADQYSSFGILQIDAHADLRKAYEGFLYSHASIMYNALKMPAVRRLVQLGIRDYCEEEQRVIQRSQGRVKTFFDEDVHQRLLEGEPWSQICDQVIKELPDLIYISFDIDGLDPKLCPNTGTPVPGGLQFHQITLLLKAIAKSGKKIIGFDLCEVAPGATDDWDANVGARILFQLCHWAGVSNGKLPHQ